MSTVSPQLALGLCILGACVATVTGYALSHLLRKTVLNEHEESSEMTNSFRHISREQRDYMVEVRRRNGDDGWERLRVELKKEKEKQSAMMQIRGGGGGSRVVSERCFLADMSAWYDVAEMRALADQSCGLCRSAQDTIILVACMMRCILPTRALDLGRALAVGAEMVVRTLVVTMKMKPRPLRYEQPLVMPTSILDGAHGCDC
jgi:hypothetical protein